MPKGVARINFLTPPNNHKFINLIMKSFGSDQFLSNRCTTMIICTYRVAGLKGQIVLELSGSKCMQPL